MKIKTVSFNRFIKWFLVLASLLITAGILLAFNNRGSMNKWLCLLLLICNALSAYRLRNNWYLLVISLVILLYDYSICSAEYIHVIHGTIFTSYAGTDISNKGLIILLAFSFLFLIISILLSHQDSTHEYKTYSILIDNRDNAIIVIGLVVVLILIWEFGFTRPTKIGERGSPSTYYEYSLILFILGFYYSGKRKLLHYLLIIIGVAYALLNFVYGGRATGIQMLLCLLFCTYFDRIPKRHLIIGGFVLFFLMFAIGTFRANTQISTATLITTWSEMYNKRFVVDTAYSAYHTSLTMIDFLNYCSWRDRLYYWGRYLLYIPFGGRIIDSNLPIITRQYFVHYYGGVLPFYFYFYLGVFGIVLISFYIMLLFIAIKKGVTNNGYWKGLAVYVTSTSLRWFIYSPAQITRGIMIYSILYAACFLFNTLKTRE